MLVILTISIATVILLISYYKWSYQYWRFRGLDYVKPSIPFGSLGNPYTAKKHIAELLKDIYDEYKKKGAKHVGLYTMHTPNYMPIDLDIVKHILTKDFAHFVNRGVYYNEEDDPMSAHLFAIEDSRWKNLRIKLTPTFTSGKMKTMFPVLVECSGGLKKIMDQRVNNNEPIDIKEELGRFTTDIIGICAFGLECKTIEEEDSLFRKYGRDIFERNKLETFIQFLAFSWTTICRKVGIRVFRKEATDFFMDIVRKNLQYREENKIHRNDFFQLLINLRNKAEDNETKENLKNLTFEELAAQCFVFFAAGFETSSTTMTFAMYELSRHPELQEKAREEIQSILSKYDGKMTYEAIQEMKYLGQIIDETLRLYPPVAILQRLCNKDYKIPDSDLIISKGMKCFIPVYGIQRDKEYYPNPEDFDPERFSEENKKNRHPYAHLPFGEGPRICIGLRFGLMQTKVGLALLLKNYKFTLDKKTEEPVKISPLPFVLTPESTIYLRGEHVQENRKECKVN